jgi:hypothetical protein
MHEMENRSDDLHRPARSSDARTPLASQAAWIGASVAALILLGALFLYNSRDTDTTAAVMPDATTGQGMPRQGPPATNR